MSYLIAKRFGEHGCIALKVEHGKALASFELKLYKASNKEVVELIVISRPSAYGEYEPYEFLDTEEEFEEKVMNM